MVHKNVASNKMNILISALRLMTHKIRLLYAITIAFCILFLFVPFSIAPSLCSKKNAKACPLMWYADKRNGKKKICELLPSHEGPLPVILMALGRSGSSITWDTISRLTGDANVAYEVTGGNHNKSQQFFDSINPNVGPYWASERLCFIQKRVIEQTSHWGIAGFQWKPYQYAMDHQYALGALEVISKHRDPSIRVIHLTRNEIDRMLSNQRHKGHIHSKEVPHHCKAGDDECVQKHKNRSNNIILHTGQKLINHLDNAFAREEDVNLKLARAGVKYLHVSYDELFNSNTTAEWIKIFQFLKRGPVANLTIDMIRKTFSMVSTSSRKHREMITNYNEVKETLNGTRYLHLLH